MDKISKLHREAMEFLDKSLASQLQGDLHLYKKFIRLAFEKEKEAASLVEKEIKFEPTRSILYRSAASLALKCDEIREAEKLISTALSGNPPNEIAEELRNLSEEVYFKMHLDFKEISLEPNEFYFAMRGDAVGVGYANSTQFIERVDNVKKMVLRTAERLKDMPFQERGRKKKPGEDIELYVSVPQVSSFAVSFRIGLGTQLKLPGMDIAQDIIGEMFECFELFNSLKIEPLRDKIKDNSYYRNFIGLAQNIAPDGEQIRKVGLITFQKGAKREVSLTTPRDRTQPLELEVSEEKVPERVKIRGILLFADSRQDKKQEIRLIDEKGKSHKIHVPPGMMSDIIRPMWEHEVTVTGIQKDKWIELDYINKVED